MWIYEDEKARVRVDLNGHTNIVNIIYLRCLL